MSDRLSFTYGEFYDFPRMLSFHIDGRWYLLRSFFDEDLDDYSLMYEVYLLPFRTEAEFKTQIEFWRPVSEYKNLGQILISEIGLDQTRRASMNADFIRTWLSERISPY